MQQRRLHSGKTRRGTIPTCLAALLLSELGVPTTQRQPTNGTGQPILVGRLEQNNRTSADPLDY